MNGSFEASGKTTNKNMKAKHISSIIAATAASFLFISCDSPQEEAAEAKADQMEDQADAVRDGAEKTADMKEDSADAMRDNGASEAAADAVEDEADVIRDQAEQKADNIEDAADEVEDAAE